MGNLSISKIYIDKEIKILEVAEGFRSTPYLDTKGLWTWGIGRNYQGYPLTLSERSYIRDVTEEPLNVDKPWSLFYSTDVLSNIPDHLARQIADYFVKQVLMEIDARFYSQTGWFAEVEDARKSAWLDLAYNVGLYGVMSWRESLKLMEDEQYEELAEHLLGFPWAHQVHADKPSPNNPTGGRAFYITEMIRTGEYPSWIKE